MSDKMEIERISIDKLVPYKHNVRLHGKRNIAEIKKSLTEFKQTKPIVVRKETMEILCGNGTYEAAKALGWTALDCHVIDIDEERGKALMIADNRSSELSEWDEKGLLDMLQEFDKETFDLTGYDENELDKMIQFHEGKLFEDEKKEKKPKKEEKKEIPVSEDDQIGIIIMGYRFVLADQEQIKEIRDLMDKFSTKNIETRCETTFEIWNSITEILKNAVSDKQEITDDGIPDIEKV